MPKGHRRNYGPYGDVEGAKKTVEEWTDEDIFLSTADFIEAAKSRRTETHVADKKTCNMTFQQALAMGTTGWEEGKQEAMRLAEDAIKLANGPFGITFDPYWDVAGSQVDLGRFLAGVPDNMVNFEPVPVSNAGKVVRLVVSDSISWSITAEHIIKRGSAIIGLAMALEELQHAVEIWIDCSVESRISTRKGRMRILVKGAHDSIDGAHLAYWLGHPTVLRQLMFGVEDGWKGGHYPGYGTPINPVEDMEEGTIYLPCLRSAYDIPEPDAFIRTHLIELGLMEGEED